MNIPQPVRRTKRRRKMKASAVDTAAEMIGAIADGDEITGITNGQFSLIDIIEHCLTQTGPADICVSTWTMGIYDQDRAWQFYRNGRIRSARWLVDPSMFSRRPEIAGSLIERFGTDNFRAVNTHAKFATIAGDDLHIVVRSSMNLNPNRRLENFDISADRALCAWFNAIVDDAFAHVDGTNTSQAGAVFRGILAEYEQIKATPELRAAAGMFAPVPNPFDPC